jgi:hypothetical protein
MHPSRLRLGPCQSRPLTDASPGSARSPGLRVCRAAPSRRGNIHTHAPFRTERQSFLRCRDRRLTIARNQRSGHDAALPRQTADATGSNPVGRAISATELILRVFFPNIANKRENFAMTDSPGGSEKSCRDADGPYPRAVIPKASRGTSASGVNQAYRTRIGNAVRAEAEVPTSLLIGRLQRNAEAPRSPVVRASVNTDSVSSCVSSLAASR